MKEKLTHNLGMKILSVVVAALVWLTIMNIADPVITSSISNIPVKVINDEVITSRGYQYEIESGENVDIRVKGKRSVVDKLTASDFSATADFNSLNAMYMAAISVECLADSAGELEITLRTENMAVKLEDQLTEPYSVRVNVVGQEKEGYCFFDTKLSSSLVQVTGSKTQMDALKEIIATVDIEGKSESYTVPCELVAYDASGHEIDVQKLSFSQDTVNVSVEIYPTKLVDVAINVIGEPADGYYVDKTEFAPAQVLIAAEANQLPLIGRLLLPCDVAGATEDIDLQINLADYLTQNYGKCRCAEEIDYIGVVATVKPMVEREFSANDSDINVINVPEGLRCVVYSLAGTKITVKGPEHILDSMSIADLRLYVDVSEYSNTGTYLTNVKSDCGGGVSVMAGSVLVNISEQPPVEYP